MYLNIIFLNDNFITAFPHFVIIAVYRRIFRRYHRFLSFLSYAKHSDIYILLRNTLYHSDNQPSLRHLPLSCYRYGSRHSSYRVVQTGFIYFLCSARLKRSGQASKSCTEESACYRRVDSKNKIANCTARTDR